MKSRISTLLFFVALSLPVVSFGQAVPAAAPAPAPRPPLVPSYFDPKAIHPELVIGPPPQPGTPAEEADLAAVHKIYDPADAALIAFAQKDAGSQNIFLYSTIFGADYNAQNLPLTAAFGHKLTNDAGIENQILKAHYQHPRPYHLDAKLPSRCGVDNSFSYPSGHSMAGYLLAYVLTGIVPEKSQEIMARADQFAEHRVVCAVHYPTDIRAGKLVSLEMYGYMLSSPSFQHDVAAVRAEVRAALKLKPLENTVAQIERK